MKLIVIVFAWVTIVAMNAALLVGAVYLIVWALRAFGVLHS